MLYYIEQDPEAPPVMQVGNRLVPLLDITVSLVFRVLASILCVMAS